MVFDYILSELPIYSLPYIRTGISIPILKVSILYKKTTTFPFLLNRIVLILIIIKECVTADVYLLACLFVHRLSVSLSDIQVV